MQLIVTNVPETKDFEDLKVVITMKSNKKGGTQNHTVIKDGEDISSEIIVFQEEE